MMCSGVAKNYGHPAKMFGRAPAPPAPPNPARGRASSYVSPVSGPPAAAVPAAGNLRHWWCVVMYYCVSILIKVFDKFITLMMP